MSEARTSVKWHQGTVLRAERERILQQRGACVWFTGLSGSGKSTVACALEARLVAEGRACYRLDGDNLRLGLNSDLGFSPEDRTENVRRVTEVALLMADAGLITIASLISPYRSDRQRARDRFEEAGLAFLEVFCDCPLDQLERRDPKGLYRKARAGELAQFTGINAPYEPPESPDVRLRTDRQSLDDEVAAVVEALRRRQVFSGARGEAARPTE